jgi:hypothetical protein
MGLGGGGLEGATSGTGVVSSPLLLQGDGVVGAPELAFDSATNTGLYQPFPNQLGIVANGGECARAKSVTNQQLIIDPASSFQNAPGEPQLQLGSSANGFYMSAGGIISVSNLGVRTADLQASGINVATGSGPAMRNVGATSTDPPFVPNQADSDTGLTRSGVDQLSMVCGAEEAIRVRQPTDMAAGQTNFFLYDVDNGQLELVTVGVADSGGLGFKLLRIAN